MSGFLTIIRNQDHLITGHVWTIQYQTCLVFRWLQYSQKLLAIGQLTFCFSERVEPEQPHHRDGRDRQRLHSHHERKSEAGGVL